MKASTRTAALVMAVSFASTLLWADPVQLFDRDGRRIGQVKPEPRWDSFELFDREGRRIGFGRPSPIDAEGRPLYELKPPRGDRPTSAPTR